MMYANRTHRNEEDAGIGIKVAVYPKSGEPEVSEVSAASPRAASEKFSRLIMEKVRDSGGRVPEEALRELIENLVHAEFRGVVVSVLEDGNVVRISDKGPGIEHKERAFEFGFSGATPEAVREIRGVGAGLGIARAAAEKSGGTVTVEDNIGGGIVATVSVGEAAEEKEDGRPPVRPVSQRKYPDAVPKMNISERQEKVLITVLECGEVGPSTVAEKLEISVSTAYRDLSVLEEHGLVAGDESGKRVISPLGRDLVENIVNAWVK
ncbi:MAG: ATP-binding protein [Rubrobacter sp.]|jgi:DNA-binding transcriptional ArsR family regulator|nr:ATP-binding protein [Rubrobacter sp.]